MRCWKPVELPELNASQPSVYESVFEVVAGVLILLWWFGLIPTPQFNTSFRLVAAPVWQALFWPVAGLMVLQLLFNLVRWLRPRWTVVRALLGSVNAVAALTIAAMIYRARSWITVVPVSIGQAEATALQSALDLACRIGIVAVLVIWMFIFGAELWRMIRSLGSGRPNGGPSAARTA
jgi:hypothetical protein